MGQSSVRNWIGIGVLLGMTLLAVGVPAAPSGDPSEIRDACVLAISTIESSNRAVIDALSIEAQVEFGELHISDVPPGADYYFILARYAVKMEKEASKNIARANKEAGKCVSRLQRIGAAQGFIDDVVEMRDNSTSSIRGWSYSQMQTMDYLLGELIY